MSTAESIAYLFRDALQDMESKNPFDLAEPKVISQDTH